jgi:hypothetical protein
MPAVTAAAAVTTSSGLLAFLHSRANRRRRADNREPALLVRDID